MLELFLLSKWVGNIIKISNFDITEVFVLFF